MPFELKVIAEPGSATECGGCPRIHEAFDSHECGAFGATLLCNREWDEHLKTCKKGGGE